MSNWFGWATSVFTPAVPPPPLAPVYAPSPVPGCDANTWHLYELLMAEREGVRYVVYYDSRDKPTGGEGHLILPSDGLKVGDKIPEATVRRWFTHDGADAMDHAVQQAKEAGITSQAFLPYLASVCYQLGDAWTAKFPNTWKMICDGAYGSAALSLGSSRWADQTPTRVEDFQNALLALPHKAAGI